MGKPLLNDDEKDALQELLDSQGWKVLLHQVVQHELTKHNVEVFSCARTGNAHNSATAIGKYDGIVALIESVYDTAGYDKPETLKLTRRGIS